MEYIFKSLYVRSEYVYVINYMNYFYLSPFPPIRHRTRFDIMSSGKEHMDFRTQYFEIWQQAWSLHKKYFGIQQRDEQRWKQLNDECETLDARFKVQSEQKFMQSLLLAVIAELEREARYAETAGTATTTQP